MNTSGRLRKDRSSASLDVHDSSANLRDSSSAFSRRPAECVRVTGELGRDENTDQDPAIDI
jgi:hypothetical protein